MELRHLRYYVAVVEAGSLTEAAEKKLHTSQPSLSRQIRDLEYQVGTALLTRTASGVVPTAAGRAFLDHARLALAQVDAAREAARRAAQPAKPTFAVGFQTGMEIDWLPAVTKVLRDELRNIELIVSSDYSPDLADALMRGKLDAALLRVEPQFPDLSYTVIAQEPLVVLMPSDHYLTSCDEINPQAFLGEIFISGSRKATVLRRVTEDFLMRAGIDITPAHGVDNIAMAISLVASTRGLSLMPAYAKNWLPWSVVSRPLKGEIPTIDLVVGYSNTNSSPILKHFLSRLGELISHARSH
jgi:LysR family hca operon transcriptional activator